MDTWELIIKSEDYFNGKDYIISKIFDVFDENVNKKSNIKEITIILPETKPPHCHGNDDYKNVKNFPYFFKKILIIFKNLEELNIINLWPWNPIYIFSEFKDIKDNYIKNRDIIANKLKKLNLGFLGYNVLDVNMFNENIIDFLGSGILKHLDKIIWETRCSINDHIRDPNNYIKIVDNLNNVYWENYNIVDYIENNEKNKEYYF